jgi:hypothetical protein
VEKVRGTVPRDYGAEKLTQERQVIVSKIILIAAIVLAAVAADAGEVVRRQVVRGPLGRRRQVTVEQIRAPHRVESIQLPRQSVIFLHPQPQPLVIFGR